MSSPHVLALAPTASGPGSGRAVFVFFAYSPTTLDGRQARMRDIVHLTDDIASLRASGYTVVTDFEGTAASLNAALAGKHPAVPGLPAAGVIWNGHGTQQGRLQEPEGKTFGPEDVKAQPNSALRLFVFAACYSMVAQSAWQAALGQDVRLHGWTIALNQKVNAAFFTPDKAVKKGLDDLLLDYLQVKALSAPAGEAELRLLISLDGKQWLAVEDPLEKALRPAKINTGDQVLAQKIATGDFYAAQVVAQADGCFQVNSDGEKAWVGPHQIRALAVPQAASKLLGCRVLAPWSDGKYYCGVLVNVKGSDYTVKFAGNDDSLKVHPDQIQPFGWLRPRLGERVQAERNGEDDVHPATLTETDGNKYLARWEDGTPPKWIEAWDIER